MGGAESFVYRVTMNSSDPYVSPMIDTSFASAVFVTPDVNSPSTADNLNVDLVTIADANTLISFNSSGNVTLGGALEKAKAIASKAKAQDNKPVEGKPSSKPTASKGAFAGAASKAAEIASKATPMQMKKSGMKKKC